MSDKEEAVAYLVCTIVRAKKAYYAGIPIMTDYVYDKLEDDLKKIDPNHPILQMVGYDDSYDWWLTHYGMEDGNGNS